MFGGSDQPPPPAQAPLQTVGASTETVPVPTTSATQKAAGAGQLPTTQTPGLLTETETTKKPSTGSLIGEG